MSTEKREDTGAHPAIPPSAPVPNPLVGLTSPNTPPTWPQYLLAGLLSLGVSGGTWLASAEARDQAQRDLERRVTAVETRVSSVDELRTDVAAQTATLQSVDRRLQRIEDSLDRRTP